MLDGLEPKATYLLGSPVIPRIHRHACQALCSLRPALADIVASKKYIGVVPQVNRPFCGIDGAG
jgi:hypothetical protein